MAKVIGGLGTSHIPAIGAALDNNKMGEPYWKDWFEGIQGGRKWMADAKPDVCIVAFNDHASAFSLELIPTFAIGVAEEFAPADEGFGRRQVPTVHGNPNFAWHLTESLIQNNFDMTIVNELDVDHGCTVPMSIAFGEVDEWPCQIVPLMINVIQYPQPSPARCFALGRALRDAIESYPEDLKVAVFGTGGLCHQLQGERAGVINKDFDLEFLDKLVHAPQEIADNWSLVDFIRESGSEGVEMIMWLVMRGALNDEVEEVFRYFRIPVSNTSYALQILENK